MMKKESVVNVCRVKYTLGGDEEEEEEEEAGVVGWRYKSLLTCA